MTLIPINLKPSTRQLRQFGTICAVVLPLLGWWASRETVWIASLATIGAAIAILSWMAPRWIEPWYRGLSLLMLPINWIVSEVTLWMTYVLIFIPIGCAFRLVGRDRLDRTIDRHCDSYWQPKLPPRSAASYYRQS